MPIAREGWPYILIPLGLSAAFFLLGFPGTALGFFLAGLLVALFFRDPPRNIPEGPHLVVSPADGKVVQVVRLSEDHAFSAGWQVSIFLSILDVHINRAPISGRIAAVSYHKGQFLPAFDHASSLRNEQNTVTIDGNEMRLTFKQIAGLIARRIVFRKQLDDSVSRGERVGMIKFGSRVDVFLPKEVQLRIQVGDRVWGGSSVIGERV